LRLRHAVEDPPETSPHEFQSRENSFLALAEEEQKKYIVLRFIKKSMRKSTRYYGAMNEEDLRTFADSLPIFPLVAEKYRNEIQEEEKQD